MGSVVDLTEWRRVRDETAPAVGSEPGEGLDHPAGRGSQEHADSPAGVERLERAVKRLHEVVSQALDLSGQVQPQVETELLAIMGELTMGLVTDAAVRAERLADRLAETR
jgi:hypothetical protein